MANLTLAMPDELHQMMAKHREIRWSEIARKAIAKHIRKLAIMDRLASKSKLTKKDIEKFDAEIKLAANKRFLNANHT